MSTTLDTDTILRRTAAVCLAGAAAIHFGVTAEHFAEWWAYGVFFVLLAGFQSVWALTCWQPVRRAWLYLGAGANVAVLALWLVTRTTGLPIGPTPFTPEPFGVADLVCGAFEAAGAVLAVVVAYRMRSAAAPPRSALRLGTAVVAAAGVIVLAASGAALAAPSNDGDGMSMAAPVAATAEPTPMPMDSAGTGNGNRMDMPELPDVTGATAAQTAAAKSLVDRLETDTAKYRDIAVAEANGYDLKGALATWHKRSPHAAPDAVISELHVPKAANRTAPLVDPSAPQYLIYRREASGTFVLIGVMFTAEHKTPPAVYLPYLRWHYHSLCVAPGGSFTRTATTTCPAGTTLRTTGYMAHVWFVSDSNLRYAFAMSAPMPQLEAHDPALR